MGRRAHPATAPPNALETSGCRDCATDMGATRKRGRWPQGSVGAALLCAKLGVQGAKRAELRARAEVWLLRARGPPVVVAGGCA